MSSELKQPDSDLVGFGATLGLADADASPAADRSIGLKTRFLAALNAQRSPRTAGAPPQQRILAGVSVWGFVLALGGMIVAVAAFVRIIATAPAWFEPTIIGVGILGMGLTVAGFATVRRPLVPWIMLAAATATLAAGAVLTVSA